MISRPSTAARYLTIPLAVFASLAVLLGIYTAGYLGLGRRGDWQAPNGQAVVIERAYTQQWMTTAFRPAAEVEAWLRGVEVKATCGRIK